jgi:phytoene/squalene synthetase
MVEEARSTTRRFARTFAIACRLLPRDVRDDVYLLYLVFRTLDDLVDFGDPDAEGHVAAVERWCAGAGAAKHPRGADPRRARQPPPAATSGGARLLRRDARRPRVADDVHRSGR